MALDDSTLRSLVTRHVGVDVAGFGVTRHDADSKISTFYYLTPSFGLFLKKVLRGVYFKKLFFEMAKMQNFHTKVP